MHPEESVQSRKTFRLDVPLHALLTQPSAPVYRLSHVGEPQFFPDPVFPQRPELLAPIDEFLRLVWSWKAKMDARADISHHARVAVPLNSPSG